MNLNRIGRAGSRQVSNQLFSLLLLSATGGAMLVPMARAQSGYSSGTVRGTVVDAQGALLPQATVTVTNTATGATRTVTTSSEGSYQVLSLNPGPYRVEVSANGFNKQIADQVVVTVGQTVEYDARLQVGTSSTVVEVTGNSAPLIDATQTQQANTITQVQEENFPNLSRNFAATVFTLPGVVDSNAPSVQDPAVGTGYQSSGFSFGGGNGRSNLFTIDGGQNDAGSGAPRVAHVPQDSVQEFQVNRNSFGPEFGFTTGSAINVITKSGTNGFHGKAFEYFHDKHTDATNYFNSFGSTPGTKPYEQTEIFGGTLGGPIKKDKLFFFTSFERQKLDSAVTTNLAGSAAAQGVAAQSNGFTGTSCPAPITQLCYLTQFSQSNPAFGGALLASSLLSPIKDPIYNALVSANTGTFDGNANNPAVQAAPNANGRYINSVSRLDYQPNQANNYSLRFSYSRESNQVIGPGGVPRFTSVIQKTRDYTITANWNHSFNGNTVNTVRVQVVPFNSVNVTTPRGGAEFDLGSLGTVGTPFDFPYNQMQNQYQFDDDLTLVKGAHNLKFGFSYRPTQYNIFQAFLFGGQYQYADGAIPLIAVVPGAIQGALAAFNAQQGYTVANGYSATGPATTNLSASQEYITGLPVALLQGSGNGQYNATTQPVGFYAQDSWKATHNITLNYGSRLDLYHEPNNYPSTTFASPRAGVAWDAFGTGKTVVRAGGGLFIAPLPFIIPFTSTVLNGDGQHIFVNAPTLANSANTTQLFLAGNGERSMATPANPNPALTLAQLASVGDVVQAPGPTSKNAAFFSVDPGFKLSYSTQASASVVQELVPSLSFELGYIYYHGTHIQQIQEANFVQDTTRPIDPFIGPFYIPKPGTTFGVPNANIIQNDNTTSAGSSTYNGLTASLTKRYGRGLFFQGNYTWSRSIDNVSDFSSGSTPLRPGLLNLDRAVSDFNVTHSFNFNGVYTTPSHHGGDSRLRYLYSDFVIAPFVSVRTGVPFTLLVPALANVNGNGAHAGEARPYHEGRNQGFGPGFASFDARISRGIVLKRDTPFRVDFIAQAANIANHTNFTSVQNIFPGQPTVGTPVGTVNLVNGPYNFRGYRPNSALQVSNPLAFKSAAIPRQIQFGIELAF